MNYFKFKKALPKSWCKETAYKKDADGWSIDNPALGQCAVTALLFNEFFGGTIYSGISKDGVMHYWNRWCGIKIDLTKQQFSDKKSFEQIRRWERNELLLTGDVKCRYMLLKERFVNSLTR